MTETIQEKVAALLAGEDNPETAVEAVLAGIARATKDVEGGTEMLQGLYQDELVRLSQDDSEKASSLT